jgi:hypothetical protein
MYWGVSPVVPLYDPESIRNTPVRTRLGRLDEATAARKPVLKVE